ncbi:MAG: hypothetical protein HY040_24825 [Planctomycetes bacterium]|nr:hypothetical protein [Planctomycetota bacterium]
MRMDCPRCGVQLRRIDMVRHLWDEHRLLLEGRRVREPWRVLDDWVVDYQLEKDPAVLARCRDLARKLEGGEGLLRLEQLLLRHGVEDADVLHHLEEKAREKDCGLCPHCFHLQPMPQSMPPDYLAMSDTVMTGAGFRLELSENGLIPILAIDGPGGRSSVTREPGGNLTRWGGVILLGGTLAILLLAASLWLFGSRVPGALLLAINLGLNLILAGVVYYLWPGPRPARDRLVNAAWNGLVPDLLERKWSGEEVCYLGSLCRSSAGAGDPRLRSTTLSSCQAALETWAEQRPEALTALAALWRLAAEDKYDMGNDPAPLLVEQASRSLLGKLPLAYAEILLEGLPPASVKERQHRSWPRGELRRLQVQLAEAAFVAGLETADIAELARLSPVLGAALGCDDLDRLTQLRLVWSMRGGKEWKHLGEVTTVFELAREPVEGALALQAQADLLLVDRKSGLIAGSEGVWLKEVCFTTEPTNIEVGSRRIINEDGFDLVVGSQRFWFAKSPTDLARRLESWFRFYFREFLPRVKGKTQGPVSAVGRRLLSRNTIACSGCRREFLPRMGKVGLSAEGTAE